MHNSFCICNTNFYSVILKIGGGSVIEIKFEDNKSVAYDGEIKIGECDFIELNNIWNITHTEVVSSYQGQGIARKLVECIIENAGDKTLKADCSYAKKILDNK